MYLQRRGSRCFLVVVFTYQLPSRSEEGYLVT